MYYTPRPRAELVQWTGDNLDQVSDFVNAEVTENEDGSLSVALDEYMIFTAQVGDILNSSGFVADPAQVAAGYQEVTSPGLRYVFES